MATSDLDRIEPEAWYAKHEFRLLLHRLRGLPMEERGRLQGLFTQTLMEQTLEMPTPHGPLRFALLGRMSAGRAITLLTKQPGTIEWIDSFKPDSLFWDIGANVGVYTLYAARRGDTKVVAFEPAAVNYFLLSANCEVNDFADKVDCLLVGMSNRKMMARLQVSQFEPGRSFSFRGKRDPEQALQAALLVSVDQLVEEYGFACPNYIKIDVPGLTQSIIEGAKHTLRRPELRELHIEMKEHTSTGEHIIERLQKSGFAISARHTHSDTTDITFSRA